LIVNIVHPEGSEILEGKRGASLRIVGSVSVLSVYSNEDEHVVELGDVPSLVLQDSEGTIWIFKNTVYEDLYPEVI